MKSPNNSAFMKLNNRLAILNIIRKDPVSRAELSRLTGLTRAAISLIVEDLVSEGIIMETGVEETEYGRKPILLDIRPSYAYAIGLDISRSGVTVGIVNFMGEVIIKKELLKGENNLQQVITSIIQAVGSLPDDAGIPRDRIMGIGISAPGPLDYKTGTILEPPNFNMWHNVAIGSILSNIFKMHTTLENNSNALAITEKNYGSGSEYKNFMVLVVDTGIGAGLIIDNKLYRGYGGYGSEVGHASIDMNGIPCSCGNKGCLEVYAAIPRLLEGIDGVDSWEKLMDGAMAGNKDCMALVEREARYLSTGIVNVINILELEAVLLTGYIRYKPELLLKTIRRYVNETSITRHQRKIPVGMSGIKRDSAVCSAASIILEKIYHGELSFNE